MRIQLHVATVLILCLAFGLQAAGAAWPQRLSRAGTGGASAATPTPTSLPGPPALVAPANHAVLPQPVPPGEWAFSWDARTGPCHGAIHITGPEGRSINAVVLYSPGSPPYQYVYTTTEILPASALEPWSWYVDVICPAGSNASETRTFSVEPASTATPTPTATPPWWRHQVYLPLAAR